MRKHFIFGLAVVCRRAEDLSAERHAVGIYKPINKHKRNEILSIVQMEIAAKIHDTSGPDSHIAEASAWFVINMVK